MLRATLIAAPILAVFAATSFPANAGSSLTQANLRELFPGVFKVVFEGSEAQIVARGNGSLIAKTLAASDKGTWSIRGSRLCVSLIDWFEGQTRCSRVTQEGDWFQARGVRFKKL